MANKKIIVSCNGICNYNTISDAVAAAENGDSIFIEGGTYKESFILDKNVEITGDISNPPVVLIDSGTVCEVTSKASVNNIKFENSNESGNMVQESLVKVSADAVFNNCDFSGSCDSNVFVSGKDVKAEFYNCNIHGSRGIGIFINEDCCPVLKNSRIYEITNYGIYIENASPVIGDCEIYDCRSIDSEPSAGMIISGTSCGSYSNCRVYDILGSGIVILEDASPEFVECEIYDCYSIGRYTGSGLELRNNCAGSYVRCRIHGIEGKGVLMTDNSSPVFEDSEIYSCDNGDSDPGAGIKMFDNCEGLFKNCRIHEIQGAALNINNNANPKLENCELYDCTGGYGFGGLGIVFFENSSGTYLNCKIHDIEGDGLSLEGTTSPVFENIEIYNCHDVGDYSCSGIILKDSSKGNYIKCKIHGIRGEGVNINDSAAPVFEYCEIFDCKSIEGFISSGIILKGSSTGSYRGCKIHEIYGTGIEVSDYSNPLVEDCEIYDCLSNGQDRGFGIVALKNAGGFFRNCKVSRIEGMCFYNTSDVKTVFENCDIAEK